MSEREKRMIRRLAERWSRYLGYKTCGDHPTESSIAFLESRLHWLVKREQTRRDIRK